MGKTKKDRNYSFKHTQQRLKERYNIDITQEHYDTLCDNIKNNKGVILVMEEKQKNDTQHTYDLHFPRRSEIRVVWSEKRQCITTALERR